MNKKPEVLLPVLTNLATDYRVYKMSKSLSNLGYQPIVLCDKPKNKLGEDWQDIQIKFVVNESHMDGFFKIWVKFIIKLFPIFLRTKSKLWIVEDCPALMLAALIGRLRGVQVIYDSHEIFLETPEVKRSPLKRIFWKFWHDGGLKWVKKMIVVSPDSKEFFENQFKHIHFLIMPNVPFSPNPVSEPRIPGSFDKHAVVLIFQGYLRAENNFKSLIMVLQKHKGYQLLIVGDGHEKGNIQNYINEAGVQNQVKMPGILPFGDLKAWTGQANIGIHLVRPWSLNIDRTWHNKIFDYIHAGLPVLMGDTVALRTLLTKHRVGIIVNPDDEKDIERGINELIENYSFYQENCRRAALEWNWDFFEILLGEFIREGDASINEMRVSPE